MGSLEKLKRKLAANPRHVRFGDLVRVLHDLGYQEVRTHGSHRVFRPAGPGPSLIVVRPHGGQPFCSVVDVKKVIALLAGEGIEDEN